MARECPYETVSMRKYWVPPWEPTDVMAALAKPLPFVPEPETRNEVSRARNSDGSWAA